MEELIHQNVIVLQVLMTKVVNVKNVNTHAKNVKTEKINVPFVIISEHQKTNALAHQNIIPFQDNLNVINVTSNVLNVKNHLIIVQNVPIQELVFQNVTNVHLNIMMITSMLIVKNVLITILIAFLVTIKNVKNVKT